MTAKSTKIVELFDGAAAHEPHEDAAIAVSKSDEEVALSTRQVLARIKEQLGLDTDIELAEAMGIGIRRIHNWKHRNTVPTEEIVAICGKEGLDLQYILTGPGPLQGGGAMQAGAKKGAVHCNFDPEQANKPRDTYTPSQCGHPRIHPPYKAYTQRSEKGEVLSSFSSPQIVDVLAPGLNWLNHSLGIAPEHFLLVKALGDNMAPWLQDGDLIMVDTSIKTTTAGGCLLLRYPDGVLMVRRVFRSPEGRLMVRDDNECSPPDAIDPNDNSTYPIVVGRVVRRLVR
ncbi:LexA family transcriptional regulator [Trichlorobacter lovleyi]|uniref:Putative phage repressor n=1 Tax=Trichlorobacter lovleyi (strain ATCC BAA-1151 / DSM 17278 / SZ) TaxID=398767 RepID=B3E5M8_TRIL1|nr:helix-turn-helix domain-containing protein [Trichlorobacter lovleyi]ACD94699.1 putative phage repressor [Trichlorobacter lovleyi SZ]